MISRIRIRIHGREPSTYLSISGYLVELLRVFTPVTLASYRLWAYVCAFGLGLMVMMVMVMMAMMMMAMVMMAMVIVSVMVIIVPEALTQVGWLRQR